MTNQKEQGRYNLIYSSNSNPLFFPEKSKSDPPDTWYRTGGDCICATCFQTYYKHPKSKWPWLIKLCNGDLVKL